MDNPKLTPDQIHYNFCLTLKYEKNLANYVARRTPSRDAAEDLFSAARIIFSEKFAVNGGGVPEIGQIMAFFKVCVLEGRRKTWREEAREAEREKAKLLLEESLPLAHITPVVCADLDPSGGWVPMARNGAFCLVPPKEDGVEVESKMESVLGFCDRHNVNLLGTAIRSIMSGDKQCETAAKLGLSEVQLSRDLRFLGQKIRGGRGREARYNDMPLFGDAA